MFWGIWDVKCLWREWGGGEIFPSCPNVLSNQSASDRKKSVVEALPCELWCSLAWDVSGCVLSTSTWTKFELGAFEHQGCSVLFYCSTVCRVRTWRRGPSWWLSLQLWVKRVPFSLGGVFKPHSDANGKNSLSESSVGLGEWLTSEFSHFEWPDEWAQLGPAQMVSL